MSALIELSDLVKKSKRNAVSAILDAFKVSRDKYRVVARQQKLAQADRGKAFLGLLYQSALDAGMTKRHAFEEMRIYYIAALVTDWKSPRDNIHNFYRIVQRRCQPTAGLDSPEIFRRDVVDEYFRRELGKPFQLNVFDKMKNANGLPMSRDDRRKGLKTPPFTDRATLFQVGIVRAEATRSGFLNDKLILQGHDGDQQLYRKIIAPLMRRVFGLSREPFIKPYARGITVRYEVKSQLVCSYLRDAIGYIDRDAEWQELDLEQVLNRAFLAHMSARRYSTPAWDRYFQNTVTVDEGYLCYVQGILAGGVQPTSMSARKHFTCRDTHDDYLSELMRVSRILDLPLQSVHPTKNQIHLHTALVRALADYDTKFNILESVSRRVAREHPPIGLFVNPHHTRYLMQRYGYPRLAVSSNRSEK